MNKRPAILDRKFKVALSFPSEKREFVEEVAVILEKCLGKGSVFYDNFYESDLAIRQLDAHLETIYSLNSELIVPFFSEEFEDKPWLKKVEWPIIRAAMFSNNFNDDSIMPICFDNTKPPGFLSIDGKIDINGRDPNAIADLIHKRISSMKSSSLSALPVPEKSSFNVGLNERVLELYHRDNLKLFRLYNDFFSHFIMDEHPYKHDVIEYIINKCAVSNNNKPEVFKVCGYQGVGKSTLLSCTYLYQYDRYKAGTSIFCPIYINLGEMVSGNSEETIIENVDVIINNISSNITKNNINSIMLFVDGIDEYYRNNSHSICENAVTRFIKSLKADSIKIVGFGQNQRGFLQDPQVDRLFWAKSRHSVSLSRMNKKNPNLDKMLSSFCALVDIESDRVAPSQLKELINDNKIEEIDLFILSLLYNAVIMNWDFYNKGTGTLYYNYCQFYYSENIIRCNTGSSNFESDLSLISEYIFNKYVHYREVQIDQQLLTLAKNLVHKHPTVKEFLIAEHVINTLISDDLPAAGAFATVYPYGINRFVKSIANRSSKTQKSIVDNIEENYSRCEIKQKIHFCYFLGRVLDPAIRSHAKHLLVNYLKDASKNKVHKNHDPVHYRKWLLLLRTINISLVWLEDDNAEKRYVQELLKNQEWDDLNRGFHLEYYEDISRKHPDFMIANDDLDVSPHKTFENLMDRLESGPPKERRLIELHTLISLCLHRHTHVTGNLDKALKDRLVSFLHNQRNSVNLSIPTFYRPYYEMALRILKQDIVSIASLIAELTATKRIKREGWNTSFEASTNKSVMRSIQECESVAEHELGCIKIAMLLPDKMPGVKGYNKLSILKMLAFHDVAESVVGDKPPHIKTAKDKQDEGQVAYAMLSMGMIDGMSGLSSCLQLWSDFQNKNGINAQIARDIDKIENLIQLDIYYNEGGQIDDYEEWREELVQSIETSVVKELLLNLGEAQYLNLFSK